MYIYTATGLLLSSFVVAQSSCDPYSTRIPGNTLGYSTAPTSYNIPGAITTICPVVSGYPCTVYCPSTNAQCTSAASSAASACKVEWVGYYCAASKYGSTATRSTTYVSVFSFSSEVISIVKPTTIPTDQTFTIYGIHNEASVSYTPVWVLGSVATYTTTTSYSTSTGTFRAGFDGPLAGCKLTSVVFTTCAGCTVYPTGTVSVYYWPDQTPRSDGSFPSAPTANPSKVVVDGVTMTSPSVYVRGGTVSARNFCSQFATAKSNLLLSFKPSDFSSMYVDKTKYRNGPFTYSSLYNFGDFTTPYNAAAYERQSKCITSNGCTKIYGSPMMTPPVAIPVSNFGTAWAPCSTRVYISAYAPIPLKPLVARREEEEILGPAPTPIGFVTSVVPVATPCSTPNPDVPNATGAIDEMKA